MNASLALGYVGTYQDSATNGYPLGNGYRVYLPELMRFTTPDSWSPFGDGGPNPYIYCANDPVNGMDPSGHFSLGTFMHILGDTIMYGFAAVDVAAGVFGAAFTGGLSLGAAVAVASGVLAIGTGIASEVTTDPKAKVILSLTSVASGIAGGYGATRAFTAGLSALKVERGAAEATSVAEEAGMLRAGESAEGSSEAARGSRAVQEVGPDSSGSSARDLGAETASMTSATVETKPLPIPRSLRVLQFASKAAGMGSMVGAGIQSFSSFFDAPEIAPNEAYGAPGGYYDQNADPDELFRSNNPYAPSSYGNPYYASEYGNPYAPYEYYY